MRASPARDGFADLLPEIAEVTCGKETLIFQYILSQGRCGKSAVHLSYDLLLNRCHQEGDCFNSLYSLPAYGSHPLLWYSQCLFFILKGLCIFAQRLSAPSDICEKYIIQSLVFFADVVPN